MPTFTKFKSKRGAEKVSSDGFCYTLRRTNLECDIWRCEIRSCYGAAVTKNDELIVTKNHNHPPDEINSSNKKLLSDIKSRALETSETPKQILNHFLPNATEFEIINLPKVKNLVDGITKHRNKNNFKNIDNLNSNDSIVPSIFLKSLNNEKWLQFEGSSEANEKILIFTTYSNLIHLENSPFWVMDGTFYSCPNEFAQLYTIQGFVRGCFYPLVYCFMEKMTSTSYYTFLNFINIKIKKQPQLIIIDFENASLLTIKNMFKNTRITSCFFHFSQSLWRRIQTFKLASKYKNDNKTNLYIKMIVALAFVPDEKIVNEFEKLVDYFLNIGVDEEIVNLLMWFQDNYIKNSVYLVGNDEEKNYYSWNVHFNILKKWPKTSNSLEGWHRSLNSIVSKKIQVCLKF